MKDEVIKLLQPIKTLLAVNTPKDLHPSFSKKLPDWLKTATLFKQPRYTFARNLAINKQLNLVPLPSNLYQHPYLELLAIPIEKWDPILKMLGGLYYTQKIKKLVDPSSQKEVIAYLSEDIYKFILKSGALYVPFLSKIKCNMTLSSWAEGLKLTGFYLLEYLWTLQPKELAQRFVLKFDSTLSWNFCHIVDFNTQAHLFNMVKRFAETSL